MNRTEQEDGTTMAAGGVATSITVASQALGAVEVRPETIITACEPLAGFPACRSYALVEHDNSTGSASRSVFWFQAVEPPFHAFVVSDPWSVFPDYAPEVSDIDAGQLELTSFEDARVYCILTIPPNPSEISVNLRAPLVINVARRLCKQVVLLNEEYHTRHFVNGPGA
jgi:flagellar assembly factor FliW